MPAPAPPLPPVADQVAEINIRLNAVLFATLLMGIYTTVYFATMYLYMTRKASHARVVACTITLLYLLSIGQLAIQWKLFQSSFVDHGETRETIFLAASTNPAWSILGSQACSAATNVLADGLLIWRCFQVWDRSFLAISAPLFFLIAETGIYASFIIYFFVVKVNPSHSQGVIIDDLIASGYFTSLFSTISSTLLIAYRIHHSLSNQNDHSKRRFIHVVDILVQSAMAYCLALMGSAITGVVIITSDAGRTVSMFGDLNYETIALLFFISGIAPTIMVARVALAADSTVAVPSMNAPISGLHFHGQSTADGDKNGGIESTAVIGYSSSESDKNTV